MESQSGDAARKMETDFSFSFFDAEAVPAATAVVGKSPGTDPSAPHPPLFSGMEGTGSGDAPSEWPTWAIIQIVAFMVWASLGILGNVGHVVWLSITGYPSLGFGEKEGREGRGGGGDGREGWMDGVVGGGIEGGRGGDRRRGGQIGSIVGRGGGGAPLYSFHGCLHSINISVVGLVASVASLSWALHLLLLPGVVVSGNARFSFCLALHGVTVTVATAYPCTGVLALLDRYVALGYGVRYALFLTRCRTLSVLLAAWVYSAALGVLPLLSNHQRYPSLTDQSHRCHPDAVFSLGYQLLVLVSILAGVFLVCSCSASVFYEMRSGGLLRQTLRQSSLQRRRYTVRWRHRDEAFAGAFVVTSLLSVGLWSPYICVAIYRASTDTWRRESSATADFLQELSLVASTSGAVLVPAVQFLMLRSHVSRPNSQDEEAERTGTKRISTASEADRERGTREAGSEETEHDGKPCPKAEAHLGGHRPPSGICVIQPIQMRPLESASLSSPIAEPRPKPRTTRYINENDVDQPPSDGQEVTCSDGDSGSTVHVDGTTSSCNIPGTPYAVAVRGKRHRKLKQRTKPSTSRTYHVTSLSQTTDVI